MQNFSKKILSVFGLSFSFLSTKEFKNFKIFEEKNDIVVLADLKKQTKQEKNDILEKNQNLKEFINELNKKEIYLLVTELSDKPILLLLHTEDRLNSEQSLIDYRHLKFLFSSSNARYIKNKNFSIYEIIRPNWFPSLSKTFRWGKSYYVDNLGGYKSICPVFFDKTSAEDFLIQTSKDALHLLKTIPVESNKEILKGLINTKIISLGLGDFIEHYSSEKNKNYLKQIEFLFLPIIETENNVSKSKQKEIYSLVNTQSFKKYQNHYYKLKE